MSQTASQGAQFTRLTADGVGFAGPCRLTQVVIYVDTAAATSAKIYDHASAASGSFFECGVPATASKGTQIFDFGEEGVNMTNGIYVDGTFGAANHSITVFYKR